MPAVGIGEPPARDLEESAEDGHEHAGVVADAEFLVDALEQALGLRRAHRGDAHQADRARHEQRRRHAVAGDVAHAQEEPSLVDEERVEEVAADARRGLHHPRDLHIRPVREQRPAQRQHAGLQLPRQLQLLLQVLQREAPPLRLQHRFVGAAHALGQCGEQVAPDRGHGHEPAPEQLPRQRQHARLALREHQRGGRLAVDGGELSDAFAGRG